MVCHLIVSSFYTCNTHLLSSTLVEEWVNFCASTGGRKHSKTQKTMLIFCSQLRGKKLCGKGCSSWSPWFPLVWLPRVGKKGTYGHKLGVWEPQKVKLSILGFSTMTLQQCAIGLKSHSLNAFDSPPSKPNILPEGLEKCPILWNCSLFRKFVTLLLRKFEDPHADDTYLITDRSSTILNKKTNIKHI